MKKNKIIVDICLIVLLAGCGKEVNKFPTTELDNEDTLVETASTSEENFEVALSDSAEESPQAVVASNESVDISSSEEDEQTVSLYTFEGDYTTILDGTYDLIANWDGQNYLNSPYALVGLDEFIFQNEWVEAWFYNNIGSWDYNESTKLDWTYEEGMEFFNEYRTKIKDLEFTSFADYELQKLN